MSTCPSPDQVPEYTTVTCDGMRARGSIEKVENVWLFLQVHRFQVHRAQSANSSYRNDLRQESIDWIVGLSERRPRVTPTRAGRRVTLTRRCVHVRHDQRYRSAWCQVAHRPNLESTWAQTKLCITSMTQVSVAEASVAEGGSHLHRAEILHVAAVTSGRVNLPVR